MIYLMILAVTPIAGFSIAESKIGKLKEEITKLYIVFPKQEINGVIHIDKEISIDDVGWLFFPQ